MLVTKKMFAVLMVVLLSFGFFTAVNPVEADIVTIVDHVWSFNTGESVGIQDTVHNVTLVFTVYTGSLNGTVNCNVDSNMGTLYVTPTTSGSLYNNNTSSSGVYLYVNGLLFTGVFSFIAGTPFTITWTYTAPSDSEPIIFGSDNMQLYFLDTAKTVNTVTAYGLEPDYGNSFTSFTDTSVGSVTYGFRVWVVGRDGTETELTEGTPVATLNRTATGAGYQNNTWTAPETVLNVGLDCLKVVVYVSFGGGAYTAKATYVSDCFMNTYILYQTWTFSLYTSATIGASTVTSFAFGNVDYKSGIFGIGLGEADDYDVMSYFLNVGDYVQFVLYKYQQIFGALGFYALLFIICLGPLYVKTRNIGVIVFTLVIFGGSGGIVWALAPSPLSFFIWFILILGLAAITFKLAK